MAKGNSDRITILRLHQAGKSQGEIRKLLKCQQNVCLEKAQVYQRDWKSYKQTQIRLSSSF